MSGCTTYRMYRRIKRDAAKLEHVLIYRVLVSRHSHTPRGAAMHETLSRLDGAIATHLHATPGLSMFASRDTTGGSHNILAIECDQQLHGWYQYVRACRRSARLRHHRT